MRSGQRGLLIMMVVLAVVAIGGCRTSDGLRRDYLRSVARITPAPTRPVIIIPGFGVSRLRDPELDRWVWGTPRATVITSYDDDLDLPVDEGGTIGSDRLEPSGFVGSRGPVNTAWQLAIALEKFGGYRVARWHEEDGDDLPTAYLFEHDWRRSGLETAGRLAELIETIREDHGDPDLRIDLLTHSAGANVALAYLQSYQNAPVDRLVMIAPPRRGTIEAFRLLTEGEKVIRRRLDPAMASTWPSVFEVLPPQTTLLDSDGSRRTIELGTIDSWRDLGRGIFDPVVREEIVEREGAEGLALRERAFEQLLGAGSRFRDLVGRPLPAEVHVTTILGDCVPTVARVVARPDGSFVFYPDQLSRDERYLLPDAFGPGDGTVAASSAEPVEGDLVRLCSGHQGLAMDPAAHRNMLRALLEEHMDERVTGSESPPR